MPGGRRSDSGTDQPAGFPASCAVVLLSNAPC